MLWLARERHVTRLATTYLPHRSGFSGKEVERLMDRARKHGRYGHRDATMILVALLAQTANSV